MWPATITFFFSPAVIKKRRRRKRKKDAPQRGSRIRKKKIHIFLCVNVFCISHYVMT